MLVRELEGGKIEGVWESGDLRKFWSSSANKVQFI